MIASSVRMCQLVSGGDGGARGEKASAAGMSPKTKSESSDLGPHFDTSLQGTEVPVRGRTERRGVLRLRSRKNLLRGGAPRDEGKNAKREACRYLLTGKYRGSEPKT